jgi:hypothetical protein
MCGEVGFAAALAKELKTRTGAPIWASKRRTLVKSIPKIRLSFEPARPRRRRNVETAGNGIASCVKRNHAFKIVLKRGDLGLKWIDMFQCVVSSG